MPRETLILVKNKRQEKEVKSYIEKYEQTKDKHETDDVMIYSIIPLSIALKNDIILPEFIFHPFLLRTRKFYEYSDIIKDNLNIINAMTAILEEEITSDKNHMSDEGIRALIRLRKKFINQQKKEAK